MKASLTHFCQVVERIESNSWWSANIPSSQVMGFTYSLQGTEEKITDVPKEPLESLLLHIRKLTMNDAPEHLLKVRKQLKVEAKESDQKLLDVWQKYWRIAMVMPQFVYENGSVKEYMTPYRLYDCFINGHLFHSNDPEYNQILHADSNPSVLKPPMLFLQNVFHCAVTNLGLAALGLKRYIDNGRTFDNIVISSRPLEALEFILHRNRVDVLEEQYRQANEDIKANGDPPNSRWS